MYVCIRCMIANTSFQHKPTILLVLTCSTLSLHISVYANIHPGISRKDERHVTFTSVNGVVSRNKNVILLFGRYCLYVLSVVLVVFVHVTLCKNIYCIEINEHRKSMLNHMTWYGAIKIITLVLLFVLLLCVL